MESAEIYFINGLATVNLVAGIGFAIPLSRIFAKVNGKPMKSLRFFNVLIVIYFLECVAFTAGMTTQFFSLGLAFVWGIVFGLWLRTRTTRPEALKTSFFLALYSSLPTAFFCIVLPVMWLINEGNILSIEEGFHFGIPGFLPWPFNTILGFCAALLIGTVVLKTVIITGEVGLLVQRGKNLEVSGAG